MLFFDLQSIIVCHNYGKKQEERRECLKSHYEKPYDNGIITLISSKNHSVRSDLMPWNNLAELRNADISACNADELTDLRNVTVSREKPLNERTCDYIGQIHNPYLFRVDTTVVKVEFGGDNDFADVLTDVIFTG